jgi:hypothetical protein
MSAVLTRYVLRAAIRDKILIALVIAMLVGTSFAIFMGTSAIVEKGPFAGVFAGGGLRLAGVAGLVLFAVFHVRRSFESKDVEFLLSRPITRTQFLLSFAGAFSLLALATTGVQAICMAMIVPDMLAPGTLMWIASIAVENIIMVNIALFFALIISSAAPCAMACFGFYLLARLMGQLLGIADMGTDAPHGVFLIKVLEIISSVTPRLDLMGQTTWLIYGPDAGIGYGFLVLQAVIFTGLVLIAARIDLSRRTF